MFDQFDPPDDPIFPKKVRGGKVAKKKYARGGGVRKANYK